ncbi:MAG: YihA family ribosome biogenesis GTP-binding protein [Desulfomonile tiedjei]|nr:YihA family ribosome biogenesis GTP-binding protein [Desulfomonile tiedjei]
MRILSASFLRAAQDKRGYPRDGLAEIAFAGRSNVGKSSMINVLLGRRDLARTSKTPGRTRQLNFFVINDRLIFVDLPGYGFARVPLEEKARWRQLVEGYLQDRKELAGIVVIVDARRPPTESDMGLINYLLFHRIPFIVAATKADKLSNSEMGRQKKIINAEVGSQVPVVFFSSHNGYGKNHLWNEIKNLID